MNTTISGLLEIQRILKERRNQLTELVKETATETTWRDPTPREKTPRYDVAKVDEKLSQINMAIYRIASKLKETNAKTSIDIEVDFDNLMAPISPK